MGESPKGSIFASLRALEEVPEETPAAAPVQQSAPPAPAQPVQPPMPQPAPATTASNDAVKSVESRIEKMEQKIQEMGAVPNLPIPDSHLDRIEALEQKLQQMQERAIQAEVSLREREKSQEAARRETEALLQNLSAQRRLEESDRQMKENLAYCRHRIEELETQQSSSKIPDPQQTEQLMRPALQALSRLETQEENFKNLISEIEEKDSLFKKTLQENAGRQKQMEEEFRGMLKNLTERIESQITPISKSLLEFKEENERREKNGAKAEEKINNLELRIDSFFSYQAKLTQDVIENQKTLAAATFQAQKAEEILKNALEQYARLESWFRNRPMIAAQTDSLHQALSHFKKMNEQTAATTKEELDKISSSLSHLSEQEKIFENWLDLSPLPPKPSNPFASNTPGKSEDIDKLEQDFQKILSVLDSGFSAPSNK